MYCIYRYIRELPKRSNLFAARAAAEKVESKVETFNIDDDEGDSVTIADPEPSTSTGFSR
jgi:hypothetical protein